MHTDAFWKYFWIAVGGYSLLCFVFVIALLYLHRPGGIGETAAVGASYDPSQDPFEKGEQPREKTALVSGYLYRDSLPLGFEDWSWKTETDWRSTTEVYEGSHAIRINFLEPWASLRASTAGISLSGYQALSLAVFPSGSLTDLYIELYDAYGRSTGKQSIGWYRATSSLLSGMWNVVTIPLENLVPRGTKEITGFSVSAQAVGSASIDAVHLEKKAVSHSRWEKPEELAPSVETREEELFTDEMQVTLPYALSFSNEAMKLWKPLFGRFERTEGGVHLGPLNEKTKGSMAVFRGGKRWTNYRADAVVYWGLTSTFSLLARFVDDGNFVSCAFSNYGAVVQIYHVRKGESTLVAQSPLLAIRDYEPWKNVLHGMSVDGDRVSCFMDNQKVLSATLPSMSPHGSVGLETWSINSDDYPHVLKSLSVSTY